ncbi:MAG: hypothetical protein O3B24_05465, partial [Verrucomicrobia bacterium]|nr:hypothetical protein [Verrucomicrobiota bacterium]
VVVKVFGRESALKNLADRGRGSKARRTWMASVALSQRGVGTPKPVAFLERWHGARLAESYFIAEYLGERVSFRDALIGLFHDDPNCARFMALLACVAVGVRRMHDAGFLHNDLGNQNILLRVESDSGWAEPSVLDLNRGRLLDRLTHRQRGRDLSRITLPSDLLRVFIEMYWDAVPPADLLRWEQHYRRRYAVHACTRRLRHPLREAEVARVDAGVRDYPAVRDMWIWDERSAQAISVLRSRDRTRHYPLRRHLRVVGEAAAALPGVQGEAKRLMRGAFAQPVAMRGRVGVALDPVADTHARELEHLRGLGRLPVFVRFYHHEDESRRAFRARAVRALHAEGYAVSIALVQDRRAVRDPGRWGTFVGDVLRQVGDVVELVEVGHAINRVKWGIWDWPELGRLYAATAEAARAFPHVNFMGPAAIDFEFPFTVAALREWPEGQPLAALSHLLYVDRRGAPENRQGRYAALEKFALARAIARKSSRCTDRLIISEVNWPLLGTGVYSPVGSPYESPGPRFHDPSVSTDAYADFMIRYLCLALCSGLVERVFWWRLVARGFGLVDDTDPSAWRPRPAYHMLAAFLRTVGDAQFEKAMLPDGALQGGETTGVYDFRFVRADGGRVSLTYAHGAAMPLRASGHGAWATDAFGARLAVLPGALTGRPVYLHGVD